jgi:hypothetical protein
MDNKTLGMILALGGGGNGGGGGGGVVLSDKLDAGETTITFSNSAITADSLIDVYADVWYSNSVQNDGSVVLTFPVQASDMVVKIKVG